MRLRRYPARFDLLPGKAVLVVGFWTAVFALLAFAGPGRIDIVDGQTRFDVARSLVEHGDSGIRDRRVWFGRFPGRGGLDHTTYRFPQSMLGVVAILAADATGPTTEDRRHFFFALTSAAAGATLGATYVLWFLGCGLPPRAALVWAILGIAATPALFYSTSTFDDILGAATAVGALTWARRAGLTERISAAVGPGLLLGLAFNCKQPLAVFALPVAILLDRPDWPIGRRSGRAAVLLAGLTAGVIAFAAYESFKFPPDTRALHAPLLLLYVPIWPGHLAEALFALALSPSAGVVWYCPAVIMALRGAWRQPRRLCLALLIAVTGFTLFVASMSIFKGDPAWGPRYFVPVYAVLWLWAPDGARVLKRSLRVALIAVSVLVQGLSLTVDPHRLYVERTLPSAFGAVAPFLYFDPPNAHLLQRPREIVELWRARRNSPPLFTPSEGLTFAFPILDRMPTRGQAGVRRYVVLNAFRPWWVAYCYLPPGERPVPIGSTLWWLLSFAASGTAMALTAVRHLSSRSLD